MEEEVVKKQQEYLDYIYEHIKNIQDSFIELKHMNNNTIKELFTNDSQLVEDVLMRVVVHDRSKYSKEEFEPYRKNFYPINDQEKEDNEEAFEKAWEHHWKNNDHHWDNRQATTTLNKPACIENLIDWMAMSKKFNNKIYDWYDNNKETIKLNPLEKEYMESIIYAIKDEDNK